MKNVRLLLETGEVLLEGIAPTKSRYELETERWSEEQHKRTLVKTWTSKDGSRWELHSNNQLVGFAPGVGAFL